MKDGTYYYFDCLDGLLGDKYWTAAELAERDRKNKPYTERKIKEIAMNYEALLMRYKYKNGEEVEEKKLYDPFEIYE